MTDSNDSIEEEFSKSKIKPKTRHIIEHFVYHDALTENKVISLDALGLELTLYETRIEHLVKNDIIIQSESGELKFYLDYEKYQVFKEQQDKRMFMIIVSIVIPAILFLLLGIAWIFSI